MNAKTATSYHPWNKGKLVGQKSPLRLRDIWVIRISLLGCCFPAPIWGTHV
jgi:hypothetical protein